MLEKADSSLFFICIFILGDDRVVCFYSSMFFTERKAVLQSRWLLLSTDHTTEYHFSQDSVWPKHDIMKCCQLVKIYLL